MQKHVNLVDLVKSFPTNIFLQNLASIQKRTSPLKFAHLTEKSEKCSISNLSTKARGRGHRAELLHLLHRRGDDGLEGRDVRRDGLAHRRHRGVDLRVHLADLGCKKGFELNLKFELFNCSKLSKIQKHFQQNSEAPGLYNV